MLLYILVGLAFCLGAGVVLGSYFGVTQLPGMLLQRKLEARLEEVAMGPDLEPDPEGKPKAILKALRERTTAVSRSVRRRDDARLGAGAVDRADRASRRRSAPCC